MKGDEMDRPAGWLSVKKFNAFPRYFLFYPKVIFLPYCYRMQGSFQLEVYRTVNYFEEFSYRGNSESVLATK